MNTLVIDLNNFAHYPTVPVGYLAAILRAKGIEVDVMSPLATGVTGYARQGRAHRFAMLDNWLRYRSAVSRRDGVRRLRRLLGKIVLPGNSKDRKRILGQVDRHLSERPDVVLISTYTMYRDVCSAIAKRCEALSIPVLIGGNYFVTPRMIAPWLELQGVSAVFGGEPEKQLCDLVRAMSSGRDISGFAGVSTPGREPVKPAAPLRDLDELPFPDYSDFPWHAYPIKVVPIMTGRGCGWGVCSFCSDVVTSAGRLFRSRSPGNVIAEIEHQAERFDPDCFVFLDLKLNSEIKVWRAIIDRLPGIAPSTAWTASVHVDDRSENGLSAYELESAAAAGLTRITTGLESGSERVLELMKKGTDLNRTSKFLRDASSVGVSVRLTLVVGHPGETANDVNETADFLEKHQQFVERVVLNRFGLMEGTPIARAVQGNPGRFPEIRHGELDSMTGYIECRNTRSSEKPHRDAVYRLMQVVFGINRKPLSKRAQALENVM